MNRKELVEKRELLQGELQEMLNVATVETRGLTQEENDAYATKEAELRSVINELSALDNEKNQTIEGEVKMEKLEIRALEDAYVKGLATGNFDEFRRLSVGAGEGLVPQDNTIPTHLMEAIIKKISENSQVVAEAKKVNATGEVTFFVEKADVLAKMLLENEEIVEEDINTFDTITLKDKRVGTMVTVTKNLLMNSPIVSESYLVEKIADRIAKRLEQQILLANGTGAEMGKGILVNVPASNKVVTATVGKVVIDDIHTAITGMKPNFLSGSKFYMNRATFQALSKEKDAVGQYFMTPDIASATPGYRLFGYPVVITEAIVDGIATGKQPILFANIGEAVAVKIAQNAQITVLREKFATRGAVGIMAEFYGDCNVVNHEAYRVISVK